MSTGSKKSRTPSAATPRAAAEIAPEAPRRTTWRREAITVAALALAVSALVAIIHRPVLSAKAIWVDESKYLFGSPVLNRPGMASAVKILSEVSAPTTVEGYYEPLTQISLMIDVARGGSVQNLRPFHETSLLLHAMNAGLVVVLLHLLFRRPWVAAMAGLAWGAHPLAVEPIAWVWERKTVLAGFFCLVTTVLYVLWICTPGSTTPETAPPTRSRSRSSAIYAAMLASFVMALLSKPISVPLPFVLLAMDYWPLRRLGRRAVIEKLPMVALSLLAAYVTVRSTHQTSGIELPVDNPAVRLLLRPTYLLGFYFGQCVWPEHLTVVYGLPEPFSLANWRVLAVVLLVVVSAVAVVWHWRRRPGLLATAAMFALPLGPTLGIIGFSWIVAADRYVYLPLVGLAVGSAGGLCWLLERVPRGVWTGVVCACGLAICGLSLRSQAYLDEWTDSVILLRNASKMSAVVQNELMVALQEQRQLTEAQKAGERAIEINPRYALAHCNLGGVLYEQDDLAGAMRYFQKAVELDPGLAEAWSNIGGLKLMAEDVSGAGEALERAVRLKPDYPDAQFNLANVRRRQSRIEEAANLYRDILRRHPNHTDAAEQLKEITSR